MAPVLLNTRVPLIEETMTIEPPPARFRCGTQKCSVRKVPPRLTSMVRSHRPQLVNRRPHAVDAGVGDDDVEAAVVPRERIDRPRHRFRIGDVGDKRQRVASRPQYLFRGFVDFLRRAAQHADAGALAGESNRRGFANPRSGASDQRDLSLKLSHRHAPRYSSGYNRHTWARFPPAVRNRHWRLPLTGAPDPVDAVLSRQSTTGPTKAARKQGDNP